MKAEEDIEVIEVIDIDNKVEDSVIIEIPDSLNSEPVWNSSGHGLEALFTPHENSSHKGGGRDAVGGRAMGGAGTVGHSASPKVTAAAKNFYVVQAAIKSPDRGNKAVSIPHENLSCGGSGRDAVGGHTMGDVGTVGRST